MLIACLRTERRDLRISDYVGSLVLRQLEAALALHTKFSNINHSRQLHLKARSRSMHLEVGLIRIALTRLAKHELAELLTLDFAIDLTSKLTNMLREQWLLSQLLRIILFQILQLSRIRSLSVVNNRLNIILQLLHYVLVL